MKDLNELLASVLAETSFDLYSTEITYDGNARESPVRRVSSSELRELCSARESRVIRRSVHVQAPERPMRQLVETLRRVLKRFVDPESDRIGHAFFIERGSLRVAVREVNGLYGLEFESSLKDFSSAVLQAAAIDGIEKVTSLLGDWVRGVPIRDRLSTVLEGLCLNGPVFPRDDIEVRRLPLTTAELPRLPYDSNRSPLDYLGKPQLTLELEAGPALFRPASEMSGGAVHHAPNGGVDFALVCEALSLEADRCVEWCGHWHEFPDAAAFSLAPPNPWSPGTTAPKALYWKSLELHDETGGATVTPLREQSFLKLDGDEVGRTLEALQRADRKVRIAVDRWRRSKGRNVRMEDRYIELRIALESLYLKDFANEYSQEMRFRLALFGAWHLGKNLEERKSMRKILRDAYDTASKAVHTGQLPPDRAQGLANAQSLCRRGILKLLREGPPADWGDLVLGESRPPAR